MIGSIRMRMKCEGRLFELVHWLRINSSIQVWREAPIFGGSSDLGRISRLRGKTIEIWWQIAEKSWKAKFFQICCEKSKKFHYWGVPSPARASPASSEPFMSMSSHIITWERTTSIDRLKRRRSGSTKPCFQQWSIGTMVRRERHEFRNQHRMFVLGHIVAILPVTVVSLDCPISLIIVHRSSWSLVRWMFSSMIRIHGIRRGRDLSFQIFRGEYH